MSREQLFWDNFPKARVEGLAIFPDGRERYEWGGWWQILSRMEYEELNFIVNGESDEKMNILKIGLIYKPEIREQGLTRALILEEEMRSRHRAVSVYLFDVRIGKNGYNIFDVVDVNQASGDPPRWKKLLWVINKPDSTMYINEVMRINRFVESANKRLNKWAQPPIPRYPT